MSTIVATQNLQVGALTDTRAATLLAAELMLFQNDLEPGPNIPIGDYTEADYTGYGAEVVTWTVPTINDEGNIEIVGTAGEFRPTGTTVQNAIYGWLLTTGAGALLAAGRFDGAPLPMESALDAILLIPRLRLTPEGIVVVVS